ncbi:hypothetical protein YT1_0615 [Rhodococcus ruber]|nr:hypothetical protein YT1_0615 [Rhodococcus ruber]
MEWHIRTILRHAVADGALLARMPARAIHRGSRCVGRTRIREYRAGQRVSCGARAGTVDEGSRRGHR